MSCRREDKTIGPERRCGEAFRPDRSGGGAVCPPYPWPASISGTAVLASVGRTFGERDRGGVRLTGTVGPADGHLVTLVLADQHRSQGLCGVHGLAVQRSDDVAGTDAGVRRR